MSAQELTRDGDVDWTLFSATASVHLYGTLPAAQSTTNDGNTEKSRQSNGTVIVMLVVVDRELFSCNFRTIRRKHLYAQSMHVVVTQHAQESRLRGTFPAFRLLRSEPIVHSFILMLADTEFS